LVEDSVVRRDVEEPFVRRSRLPEIVRLDLRAVIAGNNVARRRVLALVERYRPDVVKGVIRKIVDDGEKRFLDRLRKCHDGAWSSVNYLEVAKTGNRRTYKSVVTMTKEADKLVFRATRAPIPNRGPSTSRTPPSAAGPCARSTRSSFTRPYTPWAAPSGTSSSS
jgi:N-methylhydantoinase B